jgi:predicted extracellular nuclease
MKQILLSMSVLFAMTINAQITDCSELFFSEYVEGSSQNKAVEIYNPTNTSIDLGDYKVERFSNGATNSAGGGVTILSGVLAPGDAFVLTNGETDAAGQFGFCDPALVALGDLSEPNGSYPTPMHMNGNDALALTKNGQVVDVFGKIGEDPGTAWSDQNGTWWTNDHTLIRKPFILNGDINALDSFDPSLEWDSLPENTWGNLGAHNCDCQNASLISEFRDVSYVMYPNPATSESSVFIKSNQVIEKIEVVNILGLTILITKTNIISTKDLLKGTYFVNIKFNNGSQSDNKLVIN